MEGQTRFQSRLKTDNISSYFERPGSVMRDNSRRRKRDELIDRMLAMRIKFNPNTETREDWVEPGQKL